jgi:hypothetical protein
MKRLFAMLVVSFICGHVFAQDSSMSKQDTTVSGMKKKCIVNENGKIMMMKDGKTAMMTTTLTLKNGTTVTSDGTIKMVDGTTKALKDGEYIDMDGKTGMMKKSMTQGDK